jgi:hypothetical protein
MQPGALVARNVKRAAGPVLLLSSIEPYCKRPFSETTSSELLLRLESAPG